MKYLLDINVLIAAITINHADHAKADTWCHGKKLATCPLSELGFLRIATQPTVLNIPMATARHMLDAFLKAHQVEFVPADLPALRTHPAGSNAVTDEYLAELASSKGMKLATLDAGISHQAAELVA